MDRSPAEFDLVLSRLTRLERENRRLKQLGAATLALAASFVFMGQVRQRGGGARASGENVVEAERFVVRDRTGAIRAAFGVNPAGGVGLAVMGQTRIHLGVNLDGSGGLSLADGDGKIRVALALQSDGLAGLEVKDPVQVTRAALNVRPDGAPALRLSDASHKERVSAVVLGDASAGVLLADAAGKVRGALAIQGDGSSGIDLMDKTEKARLSLSVRPDGAPSLVLLDDKGQQLYKAPPAPR